MAPDKEELNHSIQSLKEKLFQIEEDSKANFTLRYLEESDEYEHTAPARAVLSDLNSTYSEFMYRFGTDEYEEIKETIDELRENVKELIEI